MKRRSFLQALGIGAAAPILVKPELLSATVPATGIPARVLPPAGGFMASGEPPAWLCSGIVGRHYEEYAADLKPIPCKYCGRNLQGVYEDNCPGCGAPPQ